MKNRVYILCTLLACPLVFMHCQQKPDFEAEKQKLLQLHAAQQAAHLQENAAQFVGQFDEKMVMVNRGKISVAGIEPSRQRVQAYFDAVEFRQWEDVAPPQIHFSDDASMAYVVVDKLVILTSENENKQRVEESTHFAWVSIFKKQSNGEWKIVCNASTNEPARERLLQLDTTPVYKQKRQ